MKPNNDFAGNQFIRNIIYYFYLFIYWIVIREFNCTIWSYCPVIDMVFSSWSHHQTVVEPGRCNEYNSTHATVAPYCVGGNFYIFQRLFKSSQWYFSFQKTLYWSNVGNHKYMTSSLSIRILLGTTAIEFSRHEDTFLIFKIYNGHLFNSLGFTSATMSKKPNLQLRNV